MIRTGQGWILLAVAGVVACGEERTAVELAPDSAAAANIAAMPKLTDGNIIALLDNRHQAEISLARTARTNASSQAVLDYAARMIEEHGAMKRALDSLATVKRITAEMPVGMAPIQETIAGLADTLLNTTGRSTDIAYMNGAVASHGRAVEALNRYVDAAKDEDLRALIGRTLPDMRLHLDQAIDILRGL